MKKLNAQIMKFGIVGIICFVLDYLLLIVLTEVAGIPSLMSSGISYALSTIVNYILSITMVFETDKKANQFRRFVVFVVLSVIGLGINQLIMWIGTPLLSSWMEGVKFFSRFSDYSYMVVKLFATAVVMVYNFISRKIFIENH